MKKGMYFLTAVVLFSFFGTAIAQDGDLDVTLDMTWVSKYIWRGFDLMDNKASFQPSVNVDLYNTGFSFNVWSAQPGSSGSGGQSTVNAEEFDYTITYSNSVYEGNWYAMDYAVSWVYYDFPDQPDNAADAQEFNFAFAWPEICPLGTVPHYTYVAFWPAQGGGPARDIGGFFHIFGLGYDLALPGFLPNNPEQVLSFSWDIVYNDGAGLSNVDHDWSHTVFGVSTAIECGYGTFTPAIYYQASMDDSVNDEDEFWTGLSYTMKF